jgi:hypothetical protein
MPKPLERQSFRYEIAALPRLRRPRRGSYHRKGREPLAGTGVWPLGSGFCDKRERDVDSQTKHEIVLVTIASLLPIPLITAAVISILIY